jgi:RNA polymerase sigma-70 factor (ECF subfamily)
MLSTQPAQERGLVMRDFMTAFRKLSRGSRQALLLSKLEGRSYEQIASHAGIAVGTVKSRIWRGRTALERLLSGKATGETVQRAAGGSLSVGMPAISR